MSDLSLDLYPSIDPFWRVVEFHRAFGHPVRLIPEMPTAAERLFRIRLLREELRELEEADEAGDLVEVLDALNDIIVVSIGAGLTYGVPMASGFRAVHFSNMSKLGADGKPIYRPEDGKIMKGPNYTPPTPALRDLINRASAQGLKVP